MIEFLVLGSFMKGYCIILNQKSPQDNPQHIERDIKTYPGTDVGLCQIEKNKETSNKSKMKTQM